MSTIERNGESELEQKLLTRANRDTGIKQEVVVVVAVQSLYRSIVTLNSKMFY